MSQNNELLEKLRAKRAQRTAQRKEQQRRRKLILIGSAAGAVLLAVVILCLIFLQPAPTVSAVSQRFTESPKGIFVLRNVDSAKELYLAADLPDDQFLEHLKGLDSYPDADTELLRKAARDIYDLCRTTPLPNHPIGVSNIYYDPNGGQLELIYHVDGIRYHFLVNCQTYQHSGTPAIPYGKRFDNVYFPMYEIDGKLYADFNASGKTMALCIYTDDPAKADFSDLSMRLIAY